MNYAVLMYAARHRDELLYNIYKMGKNSIEKGKQDYWTSYPKRIEEIQELYKLISAKYKDEIQKIRHKKNRICIPSIQGCRNFC
jgi:hypothetical protein